MHSDAALRHGIRLSASRLLAKLRRAVGTEAGAVKTCAAAKPLIAVRRAAYMITVVQGLRSIALRVPWLALDSVQ